MSVVRYVVLVALVVWMGGLLQTLAGEALRYRAAVAYACGGVIVVGLFVMKFVGPPPRAVAARAAIAALMLAAAATAAHRGHSSMESTTLAVTTGLGFILLSWYVRE